MKTDFAIFLIAFAITAVYFIVANFQDTTGFLQTIAFVAIAGISIAILKHNRSDDIYYSNLTVRDLALTALATAGMVAVSAVFTGVIGASVLRTQSLAVIKLGAFHSLHCCSRRGTF